MNQILEAATAAIQKAERNVHIGGKTSTFSISRDGVVKNAESLTTTSSGTGYSTPSRHNKMSWFGLSDRLKSNK